MKEIKFKAFIKWAKIILEVEIIDFSRKRIYCKTESEKPNPCDFYNFDDVILLQFANIKDKNNIDIYEGDILKDSSNRLMVVKWDDRLGTAKFVFITINKIAHIQSGRYLNTHDWITSDENDIELIGNIYENKELLD